MTLFFFLISPEIKRELVDGGELTDPDGRRIAPAVALGLVAGRFIGIAGARSSSPAAAEGMT